MKYSSLKSGVDVNSIDRLIQYLLEIYDTIPFGIYFTPTSLLSDEPTYRVQTKLHKAALWIGGFTQRRKDLPLVTKEPEFRWRGKLLQEQVLWHSDAQVSTDDAQPGSLHTELPLLLEKHPRYSGRELGTDYSIR